MRRAQRSCLARAGGGRREVRKALRGDNQAGTPQKQKHNQARVRGRSRRGKWSSRHQRPFFFMAPILKKSIRH